jgi:hypothetical protein
MPGERPGGNESAYFLRDSRWHYIWYKDWGSGALYDLEKDPEELEDVAAANPLVVNRSRRLIDRWRLEMEQAPGRRRVPPGVEAPSTGSATLSP